MVRMALALLGSLALSLPLSARQTPPSPPPAGAPAAGQEVPSTPPQAAPAEEAWYSIHVGTRAVGFLRIAILAGEGTHRKIVLDWEGPYRLLFLFTSIPWVNPPPGEEERNLMIVSVRSELEVDENWIPVQGRETATVRESSFDVMTRRGPLEWSVTADLSGRERHEGRLIEPAEGPLRWGVLDQLLVAASSRPLVPNVRFSFGWIRAIWAPGAQMRVVSWPPAGEQTFGMIGTPESTRLPGREEDLETLSITVRLHWPGEQQDSGVTLWTEADGWLARMRIELPAAVTGAAGPGGRPAEPGSTTITIEREIDELRARGNKPPFSREDRQDPFNRYVCVLGMSRIADRPVVEPTDGQGNLDELTAERAKLRADFAEAHGLNDKEQERKIVGQMEDLVAQVRGMGPAGAAALPEFEAALDEMNRMIGLGSTALLAAQRHYEAAQQALGGEQPNYSAAETALAELKKLVDDPQILHTEEYPEIARLEEEIRHLVRRMRAIQAVRAANLAITGYSTQLITGDIWEGADLRLLGLRVQWLDAVEVAWPKGYAIINDVIVQEGEWVRMPPLADPLRLVRVEDMKIVVEYQGEEVELDVTR